MIKTARVHLYKFEATAECIMRGEVHAETEEEARKLIDEAQWDYSQVDCGRNINILEIEEVG